LAALVREHIATGEPVSSQTLARESGLGVSSATIRNLSARLEADGYLHQPHTSAGRVPTDRGYRFFVDLLLESRRPSRPTAAVEYQLRQQAERFPLFDDLLASVSHFVSRASRHVGFALADNPAGGVLQRIEFVPLGGTRVLVVVVSSGNQVTQKSVDAGEPLRPDDLVQAANYLNTEFSGLELDEVRDAVIERLREDVPNLAGLKVSDRPLHAVQPYLLEGLDVFVGAEELLPVRGAAGTVSGLASVFPERVVALDGVGELRAALDRYPFQAAAKYVLGRRGVPVREDVRAPLRRLTNAEKRELDEWLESS
jgi:hypothetical protein